MREIIHRDCALVLISETARFWVERAGEDQVVDALKRIDLYAKQGLHAPKGDPVEFKEIDKGERSRTYVFAHGEFTIKNAVRVCQRPSGGQRVEDAEGNKYVIPSGWMAIKLDMDTWSF